jgi:hypothetical protein
MIASLMSALFAGYAGCIWWALAGASRRTLLAIAGWMLATFVSRIIYPHEFPWGINEDEFTTAMDSFWRYCASLPVGNVTNTLPAHLYTITIGAAWPWVGMRWAARSYSIVASTLAIPVAFGLARLVPLSVPVSLGVVLPSLMALPWALLYGRTGIGGELFLNCLVALFGLFVLLQPKLSNRQLAGGGTLLTFGLFLCCLGYTPGKIELLSALAALPFVPSERRWARVAVIVSSVAVAVLAYNAVAVGEWVWYGFQAHHLPPDERPLARLPYAFDATRMFWQARFCPVAQAVSWVQVLPVPYLACLGVGIVVALSRRLPALVVGLFVLGLLPAALGPTCVSSHRMIPGSLLVPFVAAIAVDRIPTGIKPWVTAVTAVAIAVWGTSSYFSIDSWTLADRISYCSYECVFTLAGEPRALEPMPNLPGTCPR